MSKNRTTQSLEWSSVLEVLHGQMTKGMYDSCLRGSSAMVGTDDITVILASEAARDWTADRLSRHIEKAIRMEGWPTLPLRFEVAGETSSQPQVPLAEPATTPGGSTAVDAVPTIVVRDRRKPKQFSIENQVLDEWLPIIGEKGFLLYAFYVRLSNRDLGEKAWPAYSLIEAHLRMGRSSISEYNQLLVWCGLIHIETGSMNQSNVYYILDPQEVTVEGLMALKETVEASWSEGRPMRRTILGWIEGWRPLEFLWEARRGNRGRQKELRVVKASNPNLPTTQSPRNALLDLGVWPRVVDQLLLTHDEIVIGKAIERTKEAMTEGRVKQSGAYVRSLLERGLVL